MAINLAIWLFGKLESCTWCHFVRIGVPQMTSYLKFGIFLNKNSQILFKNVRNGHNFGYIQARVLNLVSFCAYWSSPCDLILKVLNFLNKNSRTLFKKVRIGQNFGYIQARELHLVSVCAYWSSPNELILKIRNFGIFLNKNSQKLFKKVRNGQNFG
jgi:L-rhamnose mutarotase